MSPSTSTRSESFFTQGSCGDPDYALVRDHPKASDCRQFVERLWRDYARYCDGHFLSDARNHFNQRFWEMYLCIAMLKRGFKIERVGSEGPEFSTRIGNRKFWFEAVAPGAGDGPDRVPEFEIGKVGWVDSEKVVMRYTSALSEKLRKYERGREKGIIADTDGYVVAINCNKIPHAYFGSLLPFHVSAFLPFGPYTIEINPRTQEKVGEYFKYRDEVKKKSGSPVSTQAFYDPKYRGVSAVINSIFNVAGYTRANVTWGDDFDVLHNPSASNSLPLAAFRWCKNRHVVGDKLETVEQS